MIVKCATCGAEVPTATAVEIQAGDAIERFCSMRCASAAEAGKPPRAPHAVQPQPLRKILVAVDGSGPSVRAVEMAVSLASSMKASIILAHAIDPALFRLLPFDGVFGGAASIGIDPAALEQNLRDDAVNTLERCGRICEAAGVEYTCHIDMKPPVRAIADAARHADLIVMGSRGLGAISGAALGSLSHRVIAETGKPVLIVH